MFPFKLTFGTGVTLFYIHVHQLMVHHNQTIAGWLLFDLTEMQRIFGLSEL